MPEAQQAQSAPPHEIAYPQYLTVSQWGQYFDWPPPGGLRHLIFHADSNGFAPAIKRVGRRVLIDADRFWEIVQEQGGEK